MGSLTLSEQWTAGSINGNLGEWKEERSGNWDWNEKRMFKILKNIKKEIYIIIITLSGSMLRDILQRK